MDGVAKCGTLSDFGRDEAPTQTKYPIPQVQYFGCGYFSSYTSDFTKNRGQHSTFPMHYCGLKYEHIVFFSSYTWWICSWFYGKPSQPTLISVEEQEDQQQVSPLPQE